jgi:hypothetical protein
MLQDDTAVCEPGHELLSAALLQVPETCAFKAELVTEETRNQGVTDTNRAAAEVTSRHDDSGKIAAVHGMSKPPTSSEKKRVLHASSVMTLNSHS